MSQSSEPSNPAEPVATPPGSIPGGDDPADAPDPAGTPAIAPEAVERIEKLAAEYLNSVVAMAVGSPEYGRAVAAIDHLGERDFLATAAMSARLLDRRLMVIGGWIASKAPLARQLKELRKAAAELDPTSIKPNSRRSSRDEMEALDRYFDRFARRQPRLEAILASLTEGRLALEQDNAALVGEEASLATEMETLRQYAFLAGRIDAKLAAHIAEIAGTDAVRAEALRLDALPVARRRRREILTQLAVVTQGYLALRIVEDGNAEVIRAVASAINTTAAALRTAAMVAGATASQRASSEQLESARLAARTIAEGAVALEAGVSGPGGQLEMLRGAWVEVYAALDRADAQKARVTQALASADLELTRPRPIAVDRSSGDSRDQTTDRSFPSE